MFSESSIGHSSSPVQCSEASPTQQAPSTSHIRPYLLSLRLSQAQATEASAHTVPYSVGTVRSTVQYSTVKPECSEAEVEHRAKDPCPSFAAFCSRSALRGSASSSMKPFTNPALSSRQTSLRLSRYKTSMQAQQSLFQTAFKDPNQRVAHGVSKSRPFLNLWAPSPSVQQNQAAQTQKRTLASATSFYDFKPLDSKSCFHYHHLQFIGPSISTS